VWYKVKLNKSSERICKAASSSSRSRPADCAQLVPKTDNSRWHLSLAIQPSISSILGLFSHVFCSILLMITSCEVLMIENTLNSCIFSRRGLATECNFKYSEASLGAHSHNVSCPFSASATSFLGIRCILFGKLEANHVFGYSWMDSNSWVKLLLCDSAFDCDCNSLCDLSGIWS